MADRTKIPGIDSNVNAQTNVEHQRVTGHGFGEDSGFGMHKNHGNIERGTMVPGMGEKGDVIPSKSNASMRKPIVGFLVSVSRIEEGEYWVLKQGQNTIGSGSNCNVVLPEASVSGIHAILAVHRNPNNENKLNVGLIDRGSSNGTLVNGNYIGFETCQCKNWDKIRIGNYELLLLLLDVAEHKLGKEEKFISNQAVDYSERGYNPNSVSGPENTRI